MPSEQLFEQLKHPNPNLREMAMVDIAETYDEETITRLMGILGAEDVTYRRAAVKALGFIGADSIPPLVDSLLNNDNVTIKASCAKALAQVASNHPELTFPENGMQGLKLAMNDPNPVVHIASVMALGVVGSPSLDILFETLKNTENLGLAVAIINALGSIPDKRSIEVLTELMEDKSVDSYVKESATSALSRLEMVLNYQKAKPSKS
ncbi:HEAT repeat domain-containing protein [Mastigocoleus sp. MO_188.B34]|uniref:HEAT repeat domain-containing protein n=1 Tax=Mastigocoleus sp. MO_188.B34 TaxID=3036635 RepID=UPI0026146255|nr:HEAT repeat domain-containing protein [Mastigocoleus sp. MO_188.B34]MDJ0697611.1 HEAT repeat domain-containing protein [Mastigocoleus sp. MO_188.B34]